MEVSDLGTHSGDSVDYPVYGKACGEAVAAGQADCGIVVCGTGIGISIGSQQSERRALRTLHISGNGKS